MKRDILAAARAIAPRKDVHAIAADRHQGIFGGVAGEPNASYLHMLEKYSGTSNAITQSNNLTFWLPVLQITSRNNHLDPPT
jgi:hypothetical protein